MGLIFRFSNDIRGNVALIFAIMIVPIFSAVGIAVDYSRVSNEQYHLQEALDAAVIAAASEKTNILADRIAVGDAVFLGDTRNPCDNAATFSIVDQEITGISSCQVETTFLGIVGVNKFSVETKAVAAWMPSANALCVLSLNTTESDALTLDTNAQIYAPGCTVHSNSASTSGLSSYSNSHITSGKNCVVGSTSGGLSHYTPDPTTGCDRIDDPLADIAGPTVGNCDYNDKSFDDAIATVSPGVYCKGLSIEGNSVIKFNPGIYIIKDGPLYVESFSKISGVGVSFYLTGSDATIHFEADTTIDITAPSTGEMAGFLFFEDRSVEQGQVHYFDSNNISRIEGIIYLSRGTFSSDSNSNIGSDSAFTSIIADKVVLDNNATLVLNSDYRSTTVPNIALPIVVRLLQ